MSGRRAHCHVAKTSFQGAKMAKRTIASHSKSKRHGPPLDAAEFFQAVAPGRSNSTHAKKAIIFAQGDEADAVFYIRTGKVKIAIVSEQGKEAVVAILGPDEFFGEGCLIGQRKRLATASAMTECATVRVEKAEVMRLLHKPAFSEMFLAHVLTRNARIEDDLVDQLFNSTEKRLARLLLLLANFGKQGAPQEVVAKIDQETLAEMIGTTRSRVNSFMNKFRRLGFIDYNGHLEVHSTLLSVVLADLPRSVDTPEHRVERQTGGAKRVRTFRPNA
jgi:CRP/FNR family transcriptional regulator, cyclic AMP receptor protein